jgi:uncharacterized protein YegL
MQFTVEAFFNPYLPVDGSRLDTIITVSAGDTAGGPVQVKRKPKAVAYLIDTSGSMENADKLKMAKVALRQALELLDEETLFSIIAFDRSAHVVASMRPATQANKDAARKGFNQLKAHGGTSMSTALRAALAEFARAGDAIPYAQFLTDGENGKYDQDDLSQALTECEGRFSCDCWGVGVEWRPNELRTIAGHLLGTADAVPDPEHLETRFQEALARVLSKGIGDVRLRLQLPKPSKLVAVKQMLPEIVDLLKLVSRVDERNSDVPTGAWSAGESRDYYVAFTFEPESEKQVLMACRPKVVFVQDGIEVVTAGKPIAATWTSDGAASARIDAHVAHYTGQEELANAIREGLEAKARGNFDEATVLLGKAVKIASQTGNDGATARLKKVVDVVDADTGTIRLKSGDNKAEEIELEMRGTETIRLRSGTQN